MEVKNVSKGKISVDGEIELVGNFEAPYIELPWNASSFAVFATARLTVLEAWMKQACDIYTSSSSSPPLISLNPDQTDKKNSLKALEIAVEKNQESAVPKVVAVGLKSVFELIRESCLAQPELCIKALKALLDVIQGQYPETFKTEPSEVIDPLFDLLLDIATSCDSKSDAKQCESGNSLTAISCSCLLSLVTVRGETSKILQAITMLLMSPRRLALQNIYLPQVMTSLQKSVQSVVLEKLIAPDFISHGVPKSSKLMTFSFAPKELLKRTKSLKVYSMTCDGAHLYLHTSEGLFKLGSGYGGTIKSYIYLYKYDFFNDFPGWLGFAQGNLYFRNSLDMNKVDLICLDKTTFNVHCVLRLPKHVAHGVMFSDFEQLGVITSGKDVNLDVAMETVEEEETLDDEEGAGGGGGTSFGESELEGMCPPGLHKWTHEMCMVCTVCRECTGYSISCLSSMRSARIPGQECGCGEGDSGCSVCGCCRICAHENIDNSELAILGPSGAGDLHGMMRLDLIFGRPNIRLQEQLQKKLEERKQRLKGKLAMVKQHHASKLKTNRGASSSRGDKFPSQSSSQSSLSEDTTSDLEKEPKRVSTIPPARVYLPSDSPAIQVVCGLHHTVVLLENGDVFTFGSNSYGQLGVGDMMLRGGPVHIKLNVPVVQIAAGSYHTVVLTCKGDVYTFGNNQVSLGGGWGYSARAVEAIRFMVDTNVLLGGFGMFGGRGEYILKIKLIDIGTEGGDQEIEGEVLAETEEISFECDPRQKYPMLFDEPIPLQANRWYVAWAHMNGPSSDCGSCGQAMVTTDDNVVFYFKSSKKSNNGTDVVAGQIPQLLYRLITDNRQNSSMSSIRDGVYILSFDFASTVTKECFQSLVSLLKWSWNTLKTCINDTSQSKDLASTLLDLERLVYISRASLRLLRTYINKVYPKQVRGRKASGVESITLAECIGNVRSILSIIFCDVTSSSCQNPVYRKLVQDILEECRLTFVSCYHVFYPTAFLKWVCLCDLLITMNKGQISSCDRLASAMLASLCSPIVRLRRIFPIFPSVHFNEYSKKWPSEVSSRSALESPHHYPVLVEQMTSRTEGEIRHKDEIAKWSLKEVTDILLYILTSPMKQALKNKPQLHSSELVNNCAYLLTRLIAELSLLAVGASEDLGNTYGRTMYVTPSRFSRNNTTRTWNTGNGSPDAICFSVDQSGIIIAGVGIYGGAGYYEYNIELLDDSKSSGVPQEGDKPHHQKWNSLIQSQGSYGAEDIINDDIVEIKFEYPVFIKPNVKYAIRLRNFGGRCSNGDGGVSSVRGQDGTTFSFSTCSLSFNGTTQTRGQIPYILYYSNPQNENEEASSCNSPSKAEMEQLARKISLNLATEMMSRTSDVLVRSKQRVNDVNFNWDSILGSSAMMTILLPLVLSHVSRLATTDVKSAVDILLSIKELLPHVSCLNLLARAHNSYPNSNDMVDLCTTSHHYVWVESEHPYKPATVSNYRVSFPDCVKWLTVEFDPKCGTCQAEDTLQLFIPMRPENPSESSSYIAVTHKLSNGYTQWPQYTIVLPGNEVIFTLETASDYVKDDRAPSYGFKCLVTGYEWYYNPGEGLHRLESELSFLGAMCAASLLKKDLILPPTGEELDEEWGESLEDLMENVYSKHSQLLSKGFALSSIPTIHQALDGVLPYR
ncbi:E3 ubiquitin-protein ligase MYCBP2-like [Diaphorina citri]|uniref:E3 ubiquitin-protein ligase MYCBP2-like n=1 Tax=Diaphorina citri TaxID=121845 RepID=A0A3Q0JK19_DIACI|nr:E3 ubiquitin-protein ligase MYCBP2-like [Diaphorina citri]